MPCQYDLHRKSIGGYFTTLRIGDEVRNSLGTELREAATANRFDALVLVIPRKPSDGGEATIGVGDYGFGTLTRDKDEVSAYAMAELQVLDGHTLGTKTYRVVRESKAFPGIPFIDQFLDYPPDQGALLLQAKKELFDSKVRESVVGMTNP